MIRLPMTEQEGLPHFSDLRAEQEYGFSSHFSPTRLPGLGWDEGNMFSDTLFMPNCNMDDGTYDDKVWWIDAPERLRLREHHPVLREIFYNDAIRRLQAVEQLTLPPQYTTIPNTAAFSRFEHLWGSVLFVDQIATREGIDPGIALKLELRTLVSDIAHTFGSHLGDWMFQGMGGAENQHDLELKQYLEVVGINDILRKHQIEPDEVIFPDIEDWVEAGQPDLCVDRVDYGLREMNRWNQAIKLAGFGSKDFTLTPEGMLAMKDQKRARIFAEGFLLLSQEHWSEPTHRAILDMYMLRTKMFYAQGGTPRTWVFNPDLDGHALVPLHEIHPRDLMYVTDSAQELATAYPNLVTQTLDAVMKGIAQYRRQYVWPGRSDRINQYLYQFMQDYEKVLSERRYEALESNTFTTYLNEYPQTQPLGFAILSEEEAALHPPTDSMIDLLQKPLKTRQIDPLVETPHGFERLSSLDPTYGPRLQEHKAHMLQTRVARLAIPDPRTFGLLKQTIDNSEAEWQRRLQQSRRMTPAELKSLVNATSREITGSYPFMSFLSY